MDGCLAPLPIRSGERNHWLPAIIMSSRQADIGLFSKKALIGHGTPLSQKMYSPFLRFSVADHQVAIPKATCWW